MATTKYEIELSFFPLAKSDFNFLVYRRSLIESEQSVPSVRMLPEKEYSPSKIRGQREKKYRFEISYIPKDGFTAYRCYSWIEPQLTLDVLFSSLKRRAEQQDLKEKTILPIKSFSRQIAFILANHEEGAEVLWLRPYALKATGEFGFLADFAFRAKEQLPPNRRILELSLAQKGGRPNRDYYDDRYEKIRTFLRVFGESIKFIPLHDGSVARLNLSLRPLPANTLNERIYILQNNVEAPSPFQGLRQHEPLKRVTRNTKFVFLFRDEDRRRSQELFRALRGELFPTFRGMNAVFRTSIDKSNTSGMVLSGFTHTELTQVALNLRDRFPTDQVIPIVIVPFSKHKSPDDTANYYTAKHAFLQHGLSSQFVDRTKFDDRDSLKWSVSNIGLAIFAKMGGLPWKVKPTTTRGLVIGLGQAHRVIDDQIQRYFAYSVLTDSSGLYERICVLGSSPNKDDYIKSLKANLRALLISHKDQFDSFVIHATFSIQRSELLAIKELLADIAETESKNKEFAALKFNDRNDFFGYSRATNSRVPFESTVVRLSAVDHLIWFDGLNQENPTVARRPERPVHVHVLFPTTTLSEDTLQRYLQDAVNIAGANWRGFNARSMPISVYYARLIADYYGRFQELGLSDIKLEEITPWFL